MEKSSIGGLQANIAAALSYFFGLCIIFFFIEKNSKLVRFHSMQAILYAAAIFVTFFVLMIVSFIAGYIHWLLGMLVSLGLLGLALAFMAGGLFAVYKAYKGEMFKLPVIGNIAESIVSK
jgi:uncharacterized membrane protein